MAGIEDENQPSLEEVGSESVEEQISSDEVAVSATNRTKEFLDRYGQSIRRYGAETSLSIEIIDPDRAGKDQPESWAIDLDNGVIFADSRFFLEQGYELADSQFAIFHEVEHFRELRDLLNEPDGYQTWQRHRRKTSAKRRLHLLDNCLDDIRMNRTVVSRASSLEAAKSHLYQDKLFPESDFRQLPKHLQFVYTILRERMLPSEPCQIDEVVRQEINSLHQRKDKTGQSVIEVMTDPRLSSSQRLKLQEQFFEPIYERLFQEDVSRGEDQPEPSDSGARGQKGSAGEGETQPDGQSSPQGESTPDSVSQPGDQPGGEQQESGSGDNAGQGLPPSSSSASGRKSSPGNPEDIFKEYYDDYFANSPDAAINQSAVDDILEQYAKDHGLDLAPEARGEVAYASAEGVSVQDLRSYRR
ncbi:MAG: hypothetical protein NUV80_03365, partial [Candidatus Berkelbacteria bacterium]|nr:hypothetical protein [Candidatus Berkelbacteria bacterium]